LGLLGFLYAGTTSILIDEFDAGGFQRPTNDHVIATVIDVSISVSSARRMVATLRSDCRARTFGTPAESASRPYLGTGERPKPSSLAGNDLPALTRHWLFTFFFSIRVGLKTIVSPQVLPYTWRTKFFYSNP
jgi:hypothetical protein